MTALAQTTTPFPSTDCTRSTYLSSNLAKARSNIALVCKLARRLDAQAEDVGSALTRGDDAVGFAELTAETVRDLRIAAADLESFCRLNRDEMASRSQPCADAQGRSPLSHNLLNKGDA